MSIESPSWPWKPSLFTQYRIRITNEYVRIQHKNRINHLRQQISHVEKDIHQLIRQLKSIDFHEIKRFSQIQKHQQIQTIRKYQHIKRQLLHLKPKLLIGNAYLNARYCKDNRQDAKQISLIQPLISLPNIEHEFIPPAAPPIDDIIIPFQTPPPIPCRSPPSDRLQLAIDDTIVKPHRLINKTLGNISHMSFHIDPEQCSSPKFDEKKPKNVKHKKVQMLLPPPPPPPPLFSSTAIFDTHAFFTQTNTKTKKQKKKIDISRQPIISITTNNTECSSSSKKKKTSRTKKPISTYDFSEDDRTKTSKLLTDDLITARFAKNSHFQTHQNSMASIITNNEEKITKKKKKKNILGIGISSPLTSTTNQTLSPGKLDLDNEKTTKSKRSNKSKRTRVK